MFLKNLKDWLSIRQIYYIIFIISIISRKLLIWGTFPNSINFEFILISCTIQLFQKIMSRTLSNLTLTHSYGSRIIKWNIYSFHFLALPLIELATNFYFISTKWPVKDKLNFINKGLLILHQKLLLLLLNNLKLLISKLPIIRIHILYLFLHLIFL